jgi:hypothetical protein
MVAVGVIFAVTRLLPSSRTRSSQSNERFDRDKRELFESRRSFWRFLIIELRGRHEFHTKGQPFMVLQI